LGRWIRPSGRHHGEQDAEDEEEESEPANGFREAACVNRARLEFVLAPYETAENGCPPRYIVGGDGEGEECRGSCGINEAEESEDEGDNDATPDGAGRNVAETDRYFLEVAAEWECTVAGEGCLRLARSVVGSNLVTYPSSAC
jgi:hypothetical protein